MEFAESLKITSLMPKPRHGPKINWVFNPRLKISISVGVLGAVGIILVIKVHKFLDLKSSDQSVVASYPSPWVVPGLENLGNNCFLNVILQCLASCSSFREYLSKTVEEFGSLPVDEEGGDECIPLVKSLNSIVEELCTVEHKRTVISPRRLMLAMDHYIPNFNLTSQQDAEEAFSHLLSSMREEISEHCIPKKSYLADLPALPNGRILITNGCEEESQWQRWNRTFLKPFDGIVGSILVCQSCAFQISLDFQLFHSLHLSPPTSTDATIMPGCNLADCLKQFFVAEHIENYCCSNCWHNGAIEYVSSFSENKTDVEKLQRCSKNDSCDCKELSSLEAFPWSNRFSRTLKQLSIARSPKILCIHLQRASYNMFGQSVKLLGHVSFPSILDLSPFMNTGVGLKNMEAANSRIGQFNSKNMVANSLIGQLNSSFPYSNYRNMLLNSRILNSEGSEGESNSTETEIQLEHERNGVIIQNGPRLEASHGNADVITIPSRPQMYRLVSVVVHFGTGKGGHYMVYRRVRAPLDDEDPVALLESATEQWFCISDSDVHSVSEKEVMSSNASMLFYEKIDLRAK